MWQTNSWSSQFGCLAWWRVQAVSPHVGTCVCARATLSLSLGQNIMPTRLTRKSMLCRSASDCFSFQFHFISLLISATFERPRPRPRSLSRGRSSRPHRSWMNTYVANAHTTHSPTDRLHIPLWPRHLTKSIFKVIQVAKVNGNFFWAAFEWDQI